MLRCHFSLPELLIFPQLAVPAFPGATRTCWMWDDWASFHASACSRPPPPTTNTVITIVPERMTNASTLITAFTSLIKHQFNCMFILTYRRRRLELWQSADLYRPQIILQCQWRTDPFKRKRDCLWTLYGEDTHFILLSIRLLCLLADIFFCDCLDYFQQSLIVSLTLITIIESIIGLDVCGKSNSCSNILLQKMSKSPNRMIVQATLIRSDPSLSGVTAPQARGCTLKRLKAPLIVSRPHKGLSVDVHDSSDHRL